MGHRPEPKPGRSHQGLIRPLQMSSYLPLFFLLTAGGLLALMSYQDWQARSISWPAFPALGLALLGLRLWQLPAARVGEDLLVSWSGLVLLLALLGLYVRLRFRDLRFRDCLGSGDILFWAVAAVYFSPIGFLVYFIASALIALLVAINLYRQQGASGAGRIPLAGLQAACLLLFMVAEKALPAEIAYQAGRILPLIQAP